MSALDRMINGFLHFRERALAESPDLFKKLALAQHPKVLCIACCDSRVDPSLLTGAEAGEIFTVRNIANLVPPFHEPQTHHGTSSALEFAVKHLKVEDIIVLGHSQCGGIRALLEMESSNQSLNQQSAKYVYHWMQLAKQAKTKTLALHGDEPIAFQARFCEQQSVKQSLVNLTTYPWIIESVDKGLLRLHGWYFDIAECMLHSFDPTTDHFVSLRSPTTI